MKLMIILLAVFLVSCGTGFCFKIDGEYEGKKGGFEYCFDPVKSKEASVPVLTSNDGKDAVLLDKTTLEEIKAEYEQPSTKETKKKKIDQLLEKMK